MIEALILLLALLQIKHWYIDFVDQSTEEVISKGIYGDFNGIMHSAKQGFGTLLSLVIVLIVFNGNINSTELFFAVCLGLLDFAVHYNVDWLKMNYGNWDIKTPAFWRDLGLDQMAHSWTYLIIGYLVVA
jgi:hypothetical protein